MLLSLGFIQFYPNMYSILLSGFLLGILWIRHFALLQAREQAVEPTRGPRMEIPLEPTYTTKKTTKVTTKKAPAAGASKAAKPKAAPKAQKVNTKATPTPATAIPESSKETKGVDLSASKDLATFSALSTGSEGGFSFGKKTEGFAFSGAGASLFKTAASPTKAADDSAAAGETKKTTKATTKKAPAAGASKATKPKAAPKAQKVNKKATPNVGGKR
jgi:hypothetical protein